ncbi:hypothetical protein AVEN_230873-1 [Araneus ventricosus]|uniref:ribonuclease H n=1 Tax=Araneus ventricosus TaxID=182803 RepID=A0A4Y2A3V2_ARAVE|nr:hypothetical protein AVEN_230873-1 [Araneus ventricosus]
MHYKVINPIYGSLFSLRLSFTPTFGFRVGGILRNLNVNDFPTLEKVDEFPPWKDIKLNFIDDFEHLPKSTTSTLVYRSIFYNHRHRFSNYEPVFTDGSKSEDHVGTAVVIGNKVVVSERLHKFCSVFTSEIYGIYLALTKIDSLNKDFIVYTDSKSAIEALKKINTLSHPLALKCAEMYQYLTEKGLKIAFCWIPGHAGISGNEKADQASKTASLMVENFVPLGDARQAVKILILKKWQSVWDEQQVNKLHEFHPSVRHVIISNLYRRQDVILTRLRIGHTRLTHKHLLCSEPPPMCSRCQSILSVRHILIECPNFNIFRLNRFGRNITIRDLLGENPHQNLFLFLKDIGFDKLI